MHRLFLIPLSAIISAICFIVQVPVTIDRPLVHMNKFIQFTIIIFFTGALFSIHAIDGFAIWSKGSDCKRELHYTHLPNMAPGETRVAVLKGPGVDILPVISYDGVWIAWCRSENSFRWKYGNCDYHKFDNWNLYIAKIDGGKTLPAKPIKVANGYLPQWGDDASYPDKDKTLYFTEYSTQNIMKTFIRPDGSFTQPEKHATCIKKMWGSSASTQVSPDGRYILFRPNRMQVQDVRTNALIHDSIGGGGSRRDGRFPTWGPRSNYVLFSYNSVCRIDDGKVTMKNKKNGLGNFWFGISNDAYYDEGKLWVIGSIGSGINGAGDVCFREIDISGSGYNVSTEPMKIGSGNSCDIHVFRSPVTGMLPRANQIIEKGINVTSQIIKSASGLQLIIKTETLFSGYNAALYDFLGKRKTHIPQSESFQNSIPLQGITDGRYILKIKTGNISIQKVILISR